MASMESQQQQQQQQQQQLEKRQAEMTGKLQKREDDRIAEAERRRVEKDGEKAENESTDFFHTGFNKSKQEILDGLEATETMEKGQLQDHFVLLIQKLSTLKKFLSDSAMFLPKYEIEKTNEYLMSLHKEILVKKDELIPKKKFAFKSKKKVASDSAPKPKAEITEHKDLRMRITECNFSDVESHTLIKNAQETNDQDVALTRLRDCVVKIHGSPRAIHIDGLKTCKVFTGPVSGSIFIDNCTDCTFVLACQQLRTHHTTNSHFYIHVTSKAIIEDSNSVLFAPFNWHYEGIEESYQVSGLDKSRNNWSDVDDFNWLASDAKSPNWDILPESERVTTWNV